MHHEVPRWNCPTRQEFRTVESISSDFNITKHQSTLRIVTSTVPYIDEVMRSFYNSGTGIPPRSPLEWFKRRCTGHVTARRCCASGCSLQFRQQIDGERGSDALSGNRFPTLPPCFVIKCFSIQPLLHLNSKNEITPKTYDFRLLPFPCVCNLNEFAFSGNSLLYPNHVPVA